jgi:hypothetical protein
MLWLINQATAGDITSQSAPQGAAKAAEEKKGDASFGNFKIDVNA